MKKKDKSNFSEPFRENGDKDVIMQKKPFDLDEYLTRGITKMWKEILRTVKKDFRKRIFFVRFAIRSKKAGRIRSGYAKKGEHIPPFLIASITDRCNLHCLGCYARHNHPCGELRKGPLLPVERWKEIFRESAKIGVSFVLLAGGEPLMRPEVLSAASAFPQILFPVFSNGTLFDAERIRFFSVHPNLVPILSLEGDAAATDFRRGPGTFLSLKKTIEGFKNHQIVFGASITVTRLNAGNVTDFLFLHALAQAGCHLVFFVEYVPVTADTQEWAFKNEDRKRFAERLESLRRQEDQMVFVSFPGDEDQSRGCLAAGRGFFHINAEGHAEPCPFSPHSDTSLKNGSLREALRSPLFQKIRAQGAALGDHAGGCALFENDELVRSFLEPGSPSDR